MRAAALRIGLFALAGLAALAVALVLAGGGWFGASERAQMRFQTSVYGLQPAQGRKNDDDPPFDMC